ncbi:MAG: hypothetical protein ACYC66_13120 [Chloroflexota bacterium]
MKPIHLAASTCALLASLLIAGTALAQSGPQFQLGFKAVAEQLRDVVGEPLENEHWADNADSLQMTTRGMMVWRKADNWTAFTDGATTWVLGPFGLQRRANQERFGWEVPGSGVGDQARLTVEEQARAQDRQQLHDGGSAQDGERAQEQTRLQEQQRLQEQEAVQGQERTQEQQQSQAQGQGQEPQGAQLQQRTQEQERIQQQISQPQPQQSSEGGGQESSGRGR